MVLYQKKILLKRFVFLMWIYSIAAVAKNVMKTESVFKRTVF